MGTQVWQGALQGGHVVLHEGYNTQHVLTTPYVEYNRYIRTYVGNIIFVSIKLKHRDKIVLRVGLLLLALKVLDNQTVLH